MGSIGNCCCCTSDDLPEITIAGMTASAPWGRYGSEKCCWIRTYTQNTTQPEVLVDYGPLVEASNLETEIWDAALFYSHQSWESISGCYVNHFYPRKIVGGRVTHLISRVSNLYFGVFRQKTDVTIILGKISIECPGDPSPSERWSLTVLQDGYVRGVKRTFARTTESYDWAPGSTNACDWTPTYTESSSTTGSTYEPTDSAFWVVNPGTDPAKVDFRTSHTTVLDELPSGDYAVSDCMNDCTSCVVLECETTTVTGTPGSVSSCTPYDNTIYQCPGIHQQQGCTGCTDGDIAETDASTELGSLSASCTLTPGLPTTYNPTYNTTAATAADFTCSAGEGINCFGATTENIVSGTSGGYKDWIESSKTCDTTVHSSVSIDATLGPITLVFA